MHRPPRPVRSFKVQSNGSWTILVRPVSAASKWDPSKAISGTGDAVLQLVPPASGLTIITARHRGTANFVVIAYGPDGSDLLINEIGHYSGESNVVYWLRKRGFEPTQALVAAVFAAAKRGNRVLTDEEILAVVKEAR